MSLDEMGRWIDDSLRTAQTAATPKTPNADSTPDKKMPLPEVKTEPVDSKPIIARKLTSADEYTLSFCRQTLAHRLLVAKGETPRMQWVREQIKLLLLNDNFPGAAYFLSQAHGQRNVKHFEEYWNACASEGYAFWWKSLLLAGHQKNNRVTEMVHANWLASVPDPENQNAVKEFEEDKVFFDDFEACMREIKDLEAKGPSTPEALWSLYQKYRVGRPWGQLAALTTLLKLQSWHPEYKRVVEGEVAREIARRLLDDYQAWREAIKWTELVIERYPENPAVSKSGDAFWRAHEAHYQLALNSWRAYIRPPLGVTKEQAKDNYQKALDYAETVRNRFRSHWANGPRQNQDTLVNERIRFCRLTLGIK
jgi:tetratricopeptide (TPR) repeat protein